MGWWTQILDAHSFGTFPLILLSFYAKLKAIETNPDEI